MNFSILSVLGPSLDVIIRWSPQWNFRGLIEECWGELTPEWTVFIQHKYPWRLLHILHLNSCFPISADLSIVFMDPLMYEKERAIVAERDIQCTMRGTGMIASSSTFCPHPGRVIRDLFRQLIAVRHGTEALLYSNHPRKAAASSYLAIIFGRIASCVPWFLRSAAVLMQLSHQCWRWCRLW